MKKSALNWAAAGILIMGGAGLSSCAGITPRTDYRVAPDLVVNVDKSYANVVRKSEKEGIRDMRKLVEGSTYEEAWTFLPDESLWIETGLGEMKIVSSGGEKLIVKELCSELRKIFSGNKNVIKYHFHPVLAYFKSDIPGFYNRMAISSIPMDDDIFTTAILSRFFYNLQPGGTISFKICSHYGMTEYFLTEEGKRRFSKASDREIRSFSDDMLSKLKSEYRGTGKLLQECVKGFMEESGESRKIGRLFEYNDRLMQGYDYCAARMPERLAEEMSNEYVKIRFTPYGEIFGNGEGYMTLPGER
jgi:hypothetical protein